MQSVDATFLPYRERPTGMRCDECARATDLLVCDAPRASWPRFAWRGSGKARCVPCAGIAAAAALRDAEAELVRTRARAAAAEALVEELERRVELARRPTLLDHVRCWTGGCAYGPLGPCVRCGSLR